MHETEISFPILTALIVMPFVGAAVTALMPRRRPESARPVALLFAVATGALSIWLMIMFKRHDPGFQFVANTPWIKQLGISWHLGVDGISLFLVVLTGILFPLAIIGVTPHHEPKPYYAWLLLLEAGCMGVFVALDLFVFFVFFEIVLVPMYFLIGGWGYANRVYAALKFFLYTMLGSAFMLVGMLSLVVLHHNGEVKANQRTVAALEAEVQARQAGAQPSAFANVSDKALQARLDAANKETPYTFDVVKIADAQRVDDTSTGGAPWDWSAARWLFLAFAIAFAVKVPLFPLHTWLPDAHTEAPTAGSVILAGVMLKLGTYGFLRFGLYLFPKAAVWFAPAFVTLGVIGIVYGAIVAAMQKDLKRLVAYSSVAHLGFIAMGLFAITTQSLQGSVLQMVNHGLSTGALFLLVGMIYERRHTREISKLRGLQKPAPILAGVFMLVMLSSIGLPGLNGFVGEFLILLGSFLTRRWWAVVAASGVILAALYLLWAYQRVFHGEPDEDNAGTRDLDWKEGLVMLPLVGLIVFLGVYPKPVLDRIAPSVNALVSHVERHDPSYHQPSVATTGSAGGEQATKQEGAGG